MLDTPVFCLCHSTHWALCMTKAEWSGWAQAIGAIVAMLLTLGFWIWDKWAPARGTNKLFRQVAVMLHLEMQAGLQAVGTDDMDKRLNCANRIREQLRVLRAIDINRLSLDGAVLVTSLSATTFTFLNKFDYMNESIMANTAHCQEVLAPLLLNSEVAVATIKARV